jgi:tRNA (cytidine/uridine-2'-O-)-methyltransferase
MPEPVLHVVLYQPEIPFNAGNVGRTCVALGAKLWMVRPLGFLVDHKHVRRAGLDYWEHLDWEVVDDWAALVARLPSRRYWYLTKTAKQHFTEPRYQPGDVLVFGSESKGLPEPMRRENGDQCLRIPMRDKVRSLNLSVAAALVAYEAVRQWRESGAIPAGLEEIM